MDFPPKTGNRLFTTITIHSLYYNICEEKTDIGYAVPIQVVVRVYLLQLK